MENEADYKEFMDIIYCGGGGRTWMDTPKGSGVLRIRGIRWNLRDAL